MNESTRYSKVRQRKWLLARKEDLRAQLDAAQTVLARASNTRDAEVTDFKDLTDRNQQVELQDSEMRRDLEELFAVNDALQRLDDGRYGSCVNCGDEIDVHRLMAFPTAARCMKCQIAFEAAETPQR